MKTITLADGSIVDITDEQHEELIKWSEEAEKWPKKGDVYWFIDAQGKEFSCGWVNDIYDKQRLKSGNIYKTKEEAEMGAIRDRGLRVNNSAKNRNRFWVWCFEEGEPKESYAWFVHYCKPRFDTEEEAQAWGDEFSSAIIYCDKL